MKETLLIVVVCVLALILAVILLGKEIRNHRLRIRGRVGENEAELSSEFESGNDASNETK